jgi:hypothetical protein
VAELSFRSEVVQRVRAFAAAVVPSRLGDALAEALADLIDSLHSYTEEGRRLYPEIIVTPSLTSSLSPIPYRRTIPIGEAPPNEVFRRALKRCAPLAGNGWVLYVEIAEEGDARYGLASATSSELSPTLFSQLVGDPALASAGATPVLYVRPMGVRRVELRTPTDRMVVSLSLDGDLGSGGELQRFADEVTKDVAADKRVIATDFVRRLLEEATRESHGCIAAVVSDDADSIEGVKTHLPDGAYLPDPIDLLTLMQQYNEDRGPLTSVALRTTAALVKGMIAQDGITIFSSGCRVVAFNVFVPNPGASVVGGARKRAFQALRLIPGVKCALALSHDGAVSCESAT